MQHLTWKVRSVPQVGCSMAGNPADELETHQRGQQVSELSRSAVAPLRQSLTWPAASPMSRVQGRGFRANGQSWPDGCTGYGRSGMHRQHACLSGRSPASLPAKAEQQAATCSVVSQGNKAASLQARQCIQAGPLTVVKAMPMMMAPLAPLHKRQQSAQDWGRGVASAEGVSFAGPHKTLQFQALAALGSLVWRWSAALGLQVVTRRHLAVITCQLQRYAFQSTIEPAGNWLHALARLTPGHEDHHDGKTCSHSVRGLVSATEAAGKTGRCAGCKHASASTALGSQQYAAVRLPSLGWQRLLKLQSLDSDGQRHPDDTAHWRMRQSILCLWSRGRRCTADGPSICHPHPDHSWQLCLAGRQTCSGQPADAVTPSLTHPPGPGNVPHMTA